MAELLTVLLASPSPIPNILNSSPPGNISEEVWALRHELPLHLINFLRDEAGHLLAASQTVPSPTKSSAGRPAKYQYNSPLKTLNESTGDNKKLDLGKKSKKKVKLFSTHPEMAQKTPKSRINDSLEKSEVGEGVDILTSTPQNLLHWNSFDSEKFNVSSPNLNNEQKQGRQGSSKMAKRISAKFTPSPQSFSLSDFLTPTEAKRNNKKSKKSPSKMKVSTPIDEAKLPEHLHNINKVSNLSERLAKVDLDDQETFPDITKAFANKKRRIKPIMVSQPPDKENSQNSNNIFGKVLEREDFSESPFKVEEVERKTVDDREMMKESISRQTPLKMSSISPAKPSPIITRSNSVTSHGSVVSPLLVSSHQKPALILLGNLYSQVLLNNLMPNPVVEIFFLFELLLMEVPGEADLADGGQEGYLGSIHNCVFFSSFVLSQIDCLLATLDGTALRLLADNPRLSEFCPSAREKLSAMHKEKMQCPSRPVKSAKALQNVSFQSETDNRSNFPTSASFHDFKKQRDKFYSLIRRWGEESKSPDYEFSQLSSEVDLVMSMLDHPVNYAHFARLFRQQLVAMCRGETGGTGAPNEQVMSDLRRTDPLKYKRLAARLTTPGRSGGPCPSPTFTGAAEFCRDFILVCKSHKFIEHLKDSITVEIQRLDALPLEVGQEDTWGSGISKLEDSMGKIELSQDVGEELAEQYQENLLTLRILAKFLGFLEALPYSTEEALTEEISEGALAVRRSYISIDLAHHLREAESLGRLSLTVPWAVEFLGQLDQSVLLQLVVYYQHLPTSSSVLPTTKSLLSLLLGWLFEGPHFPRELLILARIQPAPQPPQDSGNTLDLAEVVGWQLVAQCCPWIAELRGLLQRWEGAHRGGSQLSLDRADGPLRNNFRKITPLAAPSEKKPSEEKEIALQVALERNFFHNQPSALRRSVDFLAERLASNVIRKVRTRLVLRERQAVMLELRQLHDSETTTSEKLPLLQSAVASLAQNSLVKVQKSEELFENLEENCTSGLQLLLSSDASTPVRETCSAIVKRLVYEKVGQYLAQHVTLAYFLREYNGEAERLCRRVVKDTTGLEDNPARVHNPSVKPPSCSLVKMKSHLRQMLVHRTDPSLSESSLLALISDVQESLGSRVDLTPTATRGLETLTVDIIVCACAYSPEVITDTVVSSVLKLWQSLVPPQLVSILCPRNLLLLRKSKKDLTWTTFSNLLNGLIKTGLVSEDAVADSRNALRDRHPDLFAEVEQLLPHFSVILCCDMGC